MMNIKRHFFLSLFLLLTLFSYSQSLHWQLVAPGVWKAIIGSPEAYSLLSASGASPDKAALTLLGAPAFPAALDKSVGRIQDGKTSLRFPLKPAEQLYGFGLQFKTVQQRGRILRLHVDHYGEEDNGRTHAPVPFYLSSEGYGVFINTARYLEVYAGTAVRRDSDERPVERNRNEDGPLWKAYPYSDAVEMLLPAAGVEVYVFAGPELMQVIQRFNLFMGGGVLPPRWGLGFMQRVKSLYSASEVLEEANAFEERGFPLDMLGLEPGWQSRAYPGSFSWDSIRFPQPAKFVKALKDKQVQVNCWINPYVSKHASIYKAIHPFTGSHLVWLGEVPDFNIPAARKIFFNQLDSNQLSIGVSGYKIDEVDGYDYYLWPDVARFPSGVSAEQMRQTYGMLAMRYSLPMFRKRNQRTYGLVRANNGGGVRFPYVLYNDYYNHRDFITALINSGTAGVLWTPEVRASESAEEWLRRFQTVVFSPLAMINAWASGTKPWSFPEVSEQIKAMALLRMHMMPYWYTEFARYHFEGRPPFYGMQLLPGFLPKQQPAMAGKTAVDPYLSAVGKEIKDQYMAGEFLLVAPLFAGDSSRQVVLPKGNWYDFYTGKFVGNGTIITVKPGLDRIPVFAKDGAIIPMMKARLHAPKPGEKTDLEIRHYGTSPGSYLLYDDDGVSYDYEKGLYSWRKITVKRNSAGKWIGELAAPVPGKPNTIGQISWRFMSEE